MGPEYYVSILSFVDKSQLEPGCSVLLHNKVGRAPARQPAWQQLPRARIARQPRGQRPRRRKWRERDRSAEAGLVPLRPLSGARPQVMSVVGSLQDETDPMVSVMKVGRGQGRRGVAGRGPKPGLPWALSFGLPAAARGERSGRQQQGPPSARPLRKRPRAGAAPWRSPWRPLP